MTETGKRSIFGRWFGGKTSETAPEEQESQETEREEAPVDIAPEIPFIFETETLQLKEPEEEFPPLEPSEPEADLAEAPPRRRWFQRLREGLTKTSSRLTDGITGVFTKRKLDDETLEELEDILIQADLGLDVSARVTASLRKSRYNSDITPEEVREVLAEEVQKILELVAQPLEVESANHPHVVLVVGVNGTGKTTTIGKYAKQFAKQGLKVMLAAGDTFRAAAIEQLKIWGERTGAEVVARDSGADASGLAFDALQKARNEGYDVLLIDTAGRLQNKAGLMAELEKIVRVIKKLDPTAPHSVILTLDATTGQNALSQVEIFGKTADVTGLVMTKLDGTARGGILVAIANKYALPVHAIGVGEGIDDLEAFSARDFARAIAGVAG